MKLVLLAALAAFALDQGSKFAMLHLLDLGTAGPIEVFGPLLVFRLGWNPGINFGFLPLPEDVTRFATVAFAILVSIAVAAWARGRKAFAHRLAAGLLIGGALGNALDRIVHGAVVDFINTSCCGIQNHYVFNIADVAIFAGAIALMILPDRDPTRETISA